MAAPARRQAIHMAMITRVTAYAYLQWTMALTIRA